MLLLEAETPTCRGYLHEVNTPFRFSVEEDIGDAPGDVGGRIFDSSEVAPHESILVRQSKVTTREPPHRACQFLELAQ
jgi:hypothetical protein